MSHPINTLGAPPSRGSKPGAERPSSRTASASGGTPLRSRPAGSPYREEGEWAHVVLFGAGVALGALLGAGAALLTAPQSGVETRLALKRRARRARVQAEDRWDGLGRELRMAARRRKHNLRHKIAESRWRASEALEG